MSAKCLDNAVFPAKENVRHLHHDPGRISRRSPDCPETREGCPSLVQRACFNSCGHWGAAVLAFADGKHWIPRSEAKCWTARRAFFILPADPGGWPELICEHSSSASTAARNRPRPWS